MKDLRLPTGSTRSRALVAGKHHRAGVQEISAVLKLSPAALRKELKLRVKGWAAAGVFDDDDRAAVNRIVEIVTDDSAGRSAEASREVRAIHRGLRERRGASPFAVVIAGIAEDSLASSPAKRSARGAAGKRGATRIVTAVTGVAVADVAGAMLSLGWCIANGKSASFTVDQMIVGAIYISAAALGIVIL